MSAEATTATPQEEQLRLNQVLAHYTCQVLQAAGCLVESVFCSDLGVRIQLHRAPGEALAIKAFEYRREVGGQIRAFFRGRHNGCRVEWPAP